MDKLKQTIALLEQAVHEYQGGIVLASSFGAEDVVLMDILMRNHIEIPVISLDTGRLPQETYAVMHKWRKEKDVKIDLYFPCADGIEAMVKKDGVNLFYDDVEKRKRCCEVRKIMPLKRALSDAKAWVTGVRREQIESRVSIKAVEDDTTFGIKKFNPLVKWLEKDVWDYIKTHDVPYNALHDQFYPSIGCAPCTRAIAVGEDPRAGRWWWEQEDAVAECGLHVSPLKKGV